MSGPTEGDLSGRTYSASEGQITVKSHTQGLGQHSFTQVQGALKGGQGYGQRYHGSKAWWSVGEYLHQGLTHQSVGLSLGHNEEETWDLSDSLADLYQAVTQRQMKEASKQKGHNRSGSGGGGGVRIDGDRSVDMKRWLDEDTSHGFIRVYVSEDETSARLFPCTLSTSAQKICLQLGIPGNSLHVQMNGDVIRRMEPFDCPLAIQNEYLAGLGYSDIIYIQEEGLKEDLAHLVRFYSGKPLSDSTYSRNQLQTYAYIRKGKLLHQWARRLCVISGTRLLIHRDKGTEPTVLQLARGSVEEVQVKGQSLVLKITSTYQGERSLYMSFVSLEDYNKWLRKVRKATVKLPSKADLSNCHLEFIPENVFINTELQILILRHNALRERPIEEDIYTIGWLDDLPRFTSLKSLNLANNQLMTFPLSLSSMQSLMELNLASNKLEELPPQISELFNLQVLHLHNNLLTSLPDEIALMKNLTVIVLAFNRFLNIPAVLLQSQTAAYKLDSIIMAGNEVSRLPTDQLMHMSHIKKIDLRLNKLQLLPTETAKFQSLEHVTHVDIRENHVTDLDIRAIKCMEYLNCEHNNLKSLQISGVSLKNVFASYNCLQTLNVSPKPEWLVSLTLSHNKLTELPNWLPDCFFLVHLDVRHNHLTSLPDRLFTEAKRLKIVKANHNRLTSLPEKIRTDTLEELHLQNNLIRQLSVELFIKAHRLRYLNMTRNKLCDLPPPNKNDSYNKLQELYLSFNLLNNRCLHKICCFPRLRVLHLARNKLSVIEENDIEKLEQLMELNVSSNNLTYLPAVLGRHPKLQVLRANCNLLQELPNFKNSSGLKVLEVSSNHLVNVNMSNLMASQMSLLDISANPNIQVKSHDIDAARNSKRLCMLDMRGQNLSLDDVRSHANTEESHFWQTGLSQTSGIRNKLSVTAINKPHFSDKGEALFAIFDGGRNEAVANVLCDIIPSMLKENRARSRNPYVYLKYCFLSAHRNLKTQGQKLGAAAAITHLHKDEKGQHILSVANVGDVQVVLCRQKNAYLLSRPFFTDEEVEDKKRVVQSGGIITEDGRVSGVTYNTRLLGCSYLYPHVIPDPHVTSTTLTSDDTFFILANHGLWQYVTYEEAIMEVMDIPDPVVAAKRLQDLAQGYGSRENISVLVVRLMLTDEERSRIKDLMVAQRSSQKELLKVLNRQEDLLQLRDGVPKAEELNGVVINKSGHARKHGSNRKHFLDNKSVGSFQSVESSDGAENVSDISQHLNEVFAFCDDVSLEEVKSHKKLKKEKSEGDSVLSAENRLYRKKTHSSSYSSSENFIKRKLADDAREKEVNHSLGDDFDNNDERFVHKPDRILSKKQIIDYLDNHYKDGQIHAAHPSSKDAVDMFIPSEHSIEDVVHPLSKAAQSEIPLEGFDNSDTNYFYRISPSKDYNVSPSESVSSIDVRVRHADDFHRDFVSNEMKNPNVNEPKTNSSVSKMKAGLSETSQLNQHEFYTRPLSPESIISQEEFVKPPVSFANIDRDALLFHQMQMARAQAQSGSSTSLDSVQSAPMQASSKDAYPPGRTSSHSIEVLVNFGENGSRKNLSDSLKGGRMALGSSLSGKLGGTKSTVISSCQANMGSESHSQLYAPKSSQKLVQVDVHSVPTSERKLASSASLNDSDTDTLVGDAEDLARIGDVETADQKFTMSKDNKFHYHYTPTEPRVIKVRRQHIDQNQGEDVNSGSDSDESLGNVSLGDGYAAMQFSRMGRQGSLSMMNVLDSETEDDSELPIVPKYVRQKYKPPFNKNNVIKSVRENSGSRQQTVFPNKDENNEYETIDGEDMQASDVKIVDEFKDDANPYEDVQCFPQEDSSKVTIPTARLRETSVASEEDIDAFYAKVNKIKMDKLREKPEEPEFMEGHLQNFLPIFMSKNDHHRQKTVENSHSHQTFSQLDSAAAKGDKKEIFFSGSDLFPETHSSTKSESIPALSNQSSFSRNYGNPQAKHFTKSPKMFRKPTPSDALGFHSSPRSSSQHLPQESSPHQANQCNIPETVSERFNFLPRSPPQMASYPSLKTFKSSANNLETETAPEHHQHPAEQPPPLLPRAPYSKTQDFQFSNSSAKPSVPPKPVQNQKFSPAATHRFSGNTSQKPTSTLHSSHPTSTHTTTLVQSDKRTHQSDQSVLSAHELYPDSHQHSLLFYPSSDINEAANKLSSQRSIVITYL